MLKIKLMRTGKKNQPAYRLVIAEAKSRRDGKCIEVIGNFQPLANPPLISIDKQRYDYWLKQGAQPTSTVGNLYKKS
ncbi:30S ribosomal protein S16 [Candidatus Collierbacteria bacterium]|nr:30S ribosomal protein S16 [Candidatus Collierbacteria bacterium]